MKISLAVFFGGRSVEHEISVISALQAIEAINVDKFTIIPVYISKDGNWWSGEKLFTIENYKDIPQLLAECKRVYMTPFFDDNFLYEVESKFFRKNIATPVDIVFPILHGTFGEDGTLQGLFELKGLPFVGSDVLSSAIGMDKIIAKKVLRESELPVLDYCWFTERDWFMHEEEVMKKINEIGYPLIVKPANLGSSVGISKASSYDELTNAVNTACEFSQRILVERMVEDLREINCSVIGDLKKIEASICEEPLKSGDILSYEDKYMSENGSSEGMSGALKQIPANIPEATAQKIQNLAIETFKVLGCSGVARIDFLIDKKTNEIYINEINTMPGSLSFYLWEPSQKTFSQLLEQLINQSLRRHREKSNLTISYGQNIFSMKLGSPKIGKFGKLTRK